jgi:multiple sugar transport system ATP-binding protein
MAGISIRDISKEYADPAGGSIKVLHNLSLEVIDGEFLTLLGPSGCGKSTLIKIIAGLEPQSTGSIAIDGVAVDALRPKQRNVAMVFQSYALYPHMTVAGNLGLPLKMRRMNAWQRLPLIGRALPGVGAIQASIARDVDDVATSLGLSQLLDRKPGQLSGGQRQRVALARAMVRHPAVFLMDEPLSNLDANMRAQTRAEITDLHRRLGVTFIYVTHDQAEAMTMSTRIVVMLEGRIQQVAPPRDVYEDPATLGVASFFGEPTINQLQGRVRHDGAIDCHGVLIPTHLKLSADTAVTIAIRPENLVVSPVPGASGIAATVTRIEYLGPATLTHAQLQGGSRVVARCDPSGRQLMPGDPIKLKPDGVLLFDASGDRLRGSDVAAVPEPQRVCV